MTRERAYSLSLVACATIAFAAGNWAARHEAVRAATSDVRHPLYYRCPMHPAVKSDTPGTTPCCGMAFEPVYADAEPAPAASPRAITVSARQQQLIGVRVGTVERAPGRVRLRLFGRVVPDERRLFRVTVGLEGYVRDSTRASTGSRVRRDEWLASISTPDARTLVSAFISALEVLQREENNGNPHPAAIRGAQSSVELATERLLTLGMSPTQIDEVRRTRIPSTIVRVSSPANGFILARHVSDGQRLEAGTELFQIADLQHVWIVASLPEGSVDDVRPGAKVQIAIPGRPLAMSGYVSGDVLPQFDAETRSVTVRVEVANPDFVLRPDMFVDVMVDVPYAPAVVIPADAVVASGLRNTVFVECEPGVFEPRQVEIGRHLDARVEVRSGLEPGERIATSGTFLLDSETRLRGIQQP